MSARWIVSADEVEVRWFNLWLRDSNQRTGTLTATTGKQTKYFERDLGSIMNFSALPIRKWLRHLTNFSLPSGQTWKHFHTFSCKTRKQIHSKPTFQHDIKLTALSEHSTSREIVNKQINKFLLLSCIAQQLEIVLVTMIDLFLYTPCDRLKIFLFLLDIRWSVLHNKISLKEELSEIVIVDPMENRHDVLMKVFKSPNEIDDGAEILSEEKVSLGQPMHLHHSRWQCTLIHDPLSERYLFAC